MRGPDLTPDNTLARIEELERELADLKRHAVGGDSFPAGWLEFLNLPTATQADLRKADPTRVAGLEESYYRDVRLGRLR